MSAATDSNSATPRSAAWYDREAFAHYRLGPSRRWRWFAAGAAFTVLAQLGVGAIAYAVDYEKLTVSFESGPSALAPGIGDMEPPGVVIEEGKVLLFTVVISNTGRLPVTVLDIPDPEWFNLELIEATYSERPSGSWGEWPRLRPFRLGSGESASVGIRMRMHECTSGMEGGMLAFGTLPVRFRAGVVSQTQPLELESELYLRFPKGGIDIDRTLPLSAPCQRLMDRLLD